MNQQIYSLPPLATWVTYRKNCKGSTKIVTLAYMKSTDQIIAHFARTTADIFSLGELRQKLSAGKPLNIKYGVDVTAPFLHLGHAVNLWMMRYLQELGHKVQFLIGDFTTRIGDPTGRSESRPQISAEDIATNAEEFIKQVGRVLITNDPTCF